MFSENDQAIAATRFVPGAGPATMSTREIADLCEKKHRNVLRDARKMLVALKLEERGYAHIWADPQNGQQYEELCLPRDLTMTLITGYNIPLRKRVIDRWQELEKKASGAVALPDFTNPAAAARAWADEVEHRQSLEIENREQSRQIEDMEPALDALERISEADGSLCITDAAKALQMRPKDLFDWLRRNGWIYRRTGSAYDLGYQSKTAAGLLEHKVTTVLRADGSERVTEQVRVTAKGLTKLATLIKPHLSLA